MRPIKNRLLETFPLGTAEERKKVEELRDYIEVKKNFKYCLCRYTDVVEYGGDKFSDEFIELVYKILKSWGMNRSGKNNHNSGSKLNDFEKFKDSIRKYEETIKKLRKHKLETIVSFTTIEPEIRTLFENLKLVYGDRPKFVTFAKTMHFFVPDLLMPMDGTYTVTFFYGNKSALYSDYESVHNRDEEHRQMYEEIFEETRKYATTPPSKEKFLNDGWSWNIPKLIDSLIIAYVKKEKKSNNK